MTKKLKPCPWCNDDLALEISIEPCECHKHNWLFVICNRCGGSGPKVLYDETDDRDEREDSAMKCWNRR